MRRSRRSPRSPRTADVESDMQGTRRRRPKRRLGVLAGSRARVIAVGATALVLAGAGATYASTVAFKNHKVGTQYANGIQISDDQVLKPIGDRLVTQLGKIMGS